MTTQKKRTIEDVLATMAPEDYVISTFTKDDGTTVDIAFRYPRARDLSTVLTVSKNSDEVAAQIVLLKMTCLTHDHGELEQLFDQRHGIALILKTAGALNSNLSSGVEVKKSS